MSIINEALKKARKDRGKFPVGEEYLNRSIEGIIVERTRKPKISVPGMVSFLSVILLVTGVLVINNLFTRPRPAVDPPPIAEEKSIPSVEPIVEVPPATVTAPPETLAEPESVLEKKLTLPRLTLNGIFYDSGRRFVMINDKIYEEGDLAQGVRIEKIFSDKVGCSFEGKYFTLGLK